MTAEALKSSEEALRGLLYTLCSGNILYSSLCFAFSETEFLHVAQSGLEIFLPLSSPMITRICMLSQCHCIYIVQSHWPLL